MSVRVDRDDQAISDGSRLAINKQQAKDVVDAPVLRRRAA